MTLDPQVQATLHWLEDPKRRPFPEWSGPMIVALVRAYAAQREALGSARHSEQCDDARGEWAGSHIGGDPGPFVCLCGIDAALALGRQEVGA